MNGKKKPFNFGSSPLMQQTEETIEKAYNEIDMKEQGMGVQGDKTPIIQERKITESVREETQNINVPIPISLHQRLGIIKYKTKQNMRDMVITAIREYVDKYEV